MNHARLVCLLLAVLFMLAAVFAACEPGTDPGDVTDGENGSDKDEAPNSYADDDTVYHTKCFAGDCVYYSSFDPLSGYPNLTFTLLDYPGDTYYACQDPTCYHNSASECPLGGVFPVCIVQREGELPVVYLIGRNNEDIYSFDAKTGETKKIGRIEFKGATEVWFYRGKLYIWASFGSNFIDRPFIEIGSLDTVTGKAEYLDVGIGTKMFGIWNERVWYITDRNMICSCALDFSDVREEYDVGIEETEYQVNKHTLGGFIDDGMIYFERNVRVPEKFEGDAFINTEGNGYTLEFTMISDIYVLDAADIDAGEHLVAEGVRTFKTHNGDLYYTKMDYDHYVESEAYTYTMDKGTTVESEVDGKTFCFDGGTLYRYDHESGNTVKVCEDIGTNLSVEDSDNFHYALLGTFDITDDYVIFGGRQYRDLNDELKDRDCCNYMCILDLKTCEWHVLVPTNYILWEEVY